MALRYVMDPAATTSQPDLHRSGKKFIAVATIMMIVASIAYYATTLPPVVFEFTWRWFGVVAPTAIAIHVVVFFMMLTRSSYRKGPFYWFIGLLLGDIVYLFFSLFATLATTPEGSSFWQGLWPVAWVPIAVSLLMFVLSYVDDVDMPKNVATWASLMASVVVLEYLAAGTNLIESHVPNHSVLLPWGYQSEPGALSSVTYLWVFALVMGSVIALFRSYRSAVSRVAKRQRLIFLIALGQYMVLAIVFDFFIYIAVPNALPSLTAFYFTIMSSLIGFGILRYGLFQLNPTSLATPILENLSEAVIGINEEMQIEFANHGAGTIFGASTTPVYGRQLRELFRSKDYIALEKALRERNGTYDIEDITIKTLSEGKSVPVALSTRPALNERGETVGYIMVIQNITELKKKTLELAREKASVERKVVERTKELHEERARLQASIEGLELGFLLVDTAGRPVIQNDALQRILKLDEPVSSLANLGQRIAGYNLVEACRKSQDNHQPNMKHEVSIGSRIMRIFITPVEVDDGGTMTVLGSVVLMEDITEAKVLERSRDEFFSIASHELRTPLTAIRGNTSMMLDYYGDSIKNPELIEMIEDVHGSSVSLIAIVNDFLDMSRLEQGKMRFERTSFAIEPIIERVVYEMKTDIREKKLGLELNTKELGALPLVSADKDRLKQVFYNLIGNAIKFTDKGTIAIHSEVIKNFLKVTVTDQGRGIPLDAQKFLFHKFQQAGPSLLTRDTTRGTGLGLYISRLIIENMGGSLILESSKEGVGSSFSFTVPLAPKGSTEAAPVNKMAIKAP